MQSVALTRTGQVFTGLVTLLMLASGGAKIAQVAPVLENFAKYNFPPGVIPVIGVIEITCAILYVVPQTSVLGAILVAAYFGGATAVHVAASEPPVVTVLLGMLAWAGIALRDPRLRAHLPLVSG